MGGRCARAMASVSILNAHNQSSSREGEPPFGKGFYCPARAARRLEVGPWLVALCAAFARELAAGRRVSEPNFLPFSS